MGETPRLTDLSQRITAQSPARQEPTRPQVVEPNGNGHSERPVIGFFTLEEAAHLLKLRRRTVQDYMSDCRVPRITGVGLSSRGHPGRRFTTVLPAESLLEITRRHRPRFFVYLERQLRALADYHAKAKPTNGHHYDPQSRDAS